MSAALAKAQTGPGGGGAETGGGGGCSEIGPGLKLELGGVAGDFDENTPNNHNINKVIPQTRTIKTGIVYLLFIILVNIESDIYNL